MKHASNGKERARLSEKLVLSTGIHYKQLNIFMGRKAAASSMLKRPTREGPDPDGSS